MANVHASSTTRFAFKYQRWYMPQPLKWLERRSGGLTVHGLRCGLGIQVRSSHRLRTRLCWQIDPPPHSLQLHVLRSWPCAGRSGTSTSPSPRSTAACTPPPPPTPRPWSASPRKIRHPPPSLPRPVWSCSPPSASRLLPSRHHFHPHPHSPVSLRACNVVLVMKCLARALACLVGRDGGVGR